MKTKTIFIPVLLSAVLALSGCSGTSERWSAGKACDWYRSTGWRTGCNFIPSTAINQIEMWQESTYDPETIDRELGWARDLGFTTARVFLSSLVWESDPEGFKNRLDGFLDICSGHGIRPVLVFFDDCWNPESRLGDQPEPKVGTHNSGWVQDPNRAQRQDTLASYPVLERYVKDVIGTFRRDPRVLWWDLYNEPSNGGNGSMPLLRNVFRWARESRPSQPVSSGVWDMGSDYAAFQLEQSDIISFHSYSRPDEMESMIRQLDSACAGPRRCHRPIICTEYLARPYGCTFRDNLPLLKRYNVSAINWGLVSGKTNTIYAWEEVISWGAEPEIWFHDILRADGSPFDSSEVVFLRGMSDRQTNR